MHFQIRFNLDNEKAPLLLERSFLVPDKVQGISFYVYNDERYIIFSQSYGNNIPSLLQIFKYDGEITNYRDESLLSVVVKISSMVEQIYTEEGLLYAVYESAARPYYGHNVEKKETIDEVDIEKAIKSLVLKKDTNNYEVVK